MTEDSLLAVRRELDAAAILNNLREADCCYFCKHRGILYGHFSDAVECVKLRNEHDSPIHVRHVQVCDKFEKKVG